MSSINPSQRSFRTSEIAGFASSLANATRLNRPRDWQAFERLTRDLFARITGDVHMDLNGRSGQPQSGVDVFGIDQRSRARVGVQCRGRGDGLAWSTSRLTAREVNGEVKKARNFHPKLDVFVLLTTGPNDVRLKKAVAELNAEHERSGGFQIQVHGWDWIEGKLGEHFDLAIQYGPIAAVAEANSRSTKWSEIAREIGLRLMMAIDLMNERRNRNDCFTLQNISKHLGSADWRRLEDITEGRSDADASELTRIANGLGISELWLIEGKAAPFLIDPEDYRGADEQYESIVKLKPQKIIFVRDKKESFDSIVVAQVDEFRWVTFHWDHPMSGEVGGTGQQQLFEYCCLMRRLYRTFDYPGGCACYGRHVESDQFVRLIEGETYPGTLFHWMRNEHWWTDFAELAESRVSGNQPRDEALRDAIHITRHVLAEFQRRARQQRWMRDTLQQVGLPVSEGQVADRYAIDAGLYDQEQSKRYPE